MARYSEERKASVLKKLLPPNNRSVADVAREEGISEPTLYNWRKQAKEKGMPVPPCVRIHVASPSWGKLESKQGAEKRNQWPVIQKNVRHPC